ncbi:hypothetical protein BDV93DRAFT_610318 [Ceratobasidium sp. AG-I]|nr:hypothetical protein BDV93DRAFT_610318 [Ceratobasidium sp. AG-I]
MSIGKPIRNIVSGPFTGRIIRFQLYEYQKPDVGRKFAKRDRRPVDPPPVIRLRLFEVTDEGTPNEREQELHAESIDVSGLVAHVDLFAVHPSEGIVRAHGTEDLPPGTAGPSSNIPNPRSAIERSGQVSSHHEEPTEEGRIVVDEGAILTSAVFGSSFVHAVQVLDISGEHVILFVFADLSVKLEGLFVYRYRCFDLFSRVAGSEDIPIAAELFSGVFEIYSTKEFPGLQASTPLTKHLGLWGVRVNLRETSRRRKGKGQANGDDEEEDEDEGSSRAGDIPIEESNEVQFYSQQYLAPHTIHHTDPQHFPPGVFNTQQSYQQNVEHYEAMPELSRRNSGLE